MKIAQIVCTFPPYNGGIGASAKRFGDILATDYQVTTFTLQPKGFTTIQESDVIRLKPLLRYGHGGLPFSLLSTLNKFDCIYLHYPFFGASELIWLFLLFNKKTKLVIHYHMDTGHLAWYLKILAWPSSLIKESLFKRADKIISASLDYLYNSQIADFAKNHPEKICEIPFGLDTDKFLPKMPEPKNNIMAKAKDIINFVTKHFIKRGQVNLLFVGGLDSAHYFKGLDVLLQALSELKNNNWNLKIVGSGNLQSNYEANSLKLGLEKKVHFLGKLDDTTLIKTYQASDLFILPSINSHEAFGLVLMEAMACGVPVIASRLPGVRTVFRDGVDGLACNINDSHDLAAKIELLITDEKKRVAMGHSARSYAVSKYSWDAVADRFKKVFI